MAGEDVVQRVLLQLGVEGQDLIEQLNQLMEENVQRLAATLQSLAAAGTISVETLLPVRTALTEMANATKILQGVAKTTTQDIQAGNAAIKSSYQDVKDSLKAQIASMKADLAGFAQRDKELTAEFKQGEKDKTDAAKATAAELKNIADSIKGAEKTEAEAAREAAKDFALAEKQKADAAKAAAAELKEAFRTSEESAKAYKESLRDQIATLKAEITESDRAAAALAKLARTADDVMTSQRTMERASANVTRETKLLDSALQDLARDERTAAKATVETADAQTKAATATSRISTATDGVAKSSKNASMMAIELGRGFEDFAVTGGQFRGVINNVNRGIEIFGMQAGLSGTALAGMAIGATVVGMALDQVIVPAIKHVIETSPDLKAFFEELDKNLNPGYVEVYTRALDAMEARLKALDEKPIKTAVDFRDIEILQERIDSASRAWNDLKASMGAKSDVEKEAGTMVAHGLANVPGGQKALTERLVAERSKELLADDFTLADLRRKKIEADQKVAAYGEGDDVQVPRRLLDQRAGLERAIAIRQKELSGMTGEAGKQVGAMIGEAERGDVHKQAELARRIRETKDKKGQLPAGYDTLAFEVESAHEAAKHELAVPGLEKEEAHKKKAEKEKFDFEHGALVREARENEGAYDEQVKAKGKAAKEHAQKIQQAANAHRKGIEADPAFREITLEMLAAGKDEAAIQARLAPQVARRLQGAPGLRGMDRSQVARQLVADAVRDESGRNAQFAGGAAEGLDAFEAKEQAKVVRADRRQQGEQRRGQKQMGQMAKEEFLQTEAAGYENEGADPRQAAALAHRTLNLFQSGLSLVAAEREAMMEAMRRIERLEAETASMRRGRQQLNTKNSNLSYVQQ